MSEALSLSRPLEGLWQRFGRASALTCAHPRETLGFGILGLLGVGAIATAVALAPNSVGAAPPAPPPLIVRNLAPDQAVKVNAEIAVTQGPNPAALPFKFKGDAAVRGQALQCLASAVYYEAGSQDDDG